MDRRLPFRRRRSAEPAPVVTEPAASAPETPGTAEVLTPSPAPDETAVHAPVLIDPSAPAGTEPVAPDAPSFRTRGRMRRRLRYLRRVRELAFRDVGGLVFDLHRFGRQGGELVAGKLAALGGIDAELRALEEALGDRRELTILREPGIAACPRCAALHGSDANFCPSCGLRLEAQAISAVGFEPSATPSPVGGVADAQPRATAPVTTDPTPVATEPAPVTAEPAPVTPAPTEAGAGGSVRASDVGDTPVRAIDPAAPNAPLTWVDPGQQATTEQPAVEPGGGPGPTRTS